MNRDHYTIGYRELRALVEDLLGPPPAVDREALLGALGEHLRTHCRNCGELLDRRLRVEAQVFCYACVESGPVTSRG